MNGFVDVILLSWSWRIEILLSLGLAAALHLAGRWRLRRRGGKNLVAPWRSAAYLGGLVVVAVALMSPIDTLASQFFYMHMIQHLLLVMVAPVLLWIADPMPVAMWGLPTTLRREVGNWLKPGAAFRRTLRAVTTPGLTWIYFVVVLVGWHDPNAYNAALESDLVHDLEHLTFFGTAMLFWWHLIGAAPHIHKPLSRWMRVAYALSVVPANMLVGVAISFATRPIYSFYTRVARPGTMTILQDQMLAGVLMWIPGSMMYILAALVFLAQLLGEEERKEPLPESKWATEEHMLAPGLEKQEKRQ
jgi:cytochrome c oxidase assembly factor CtaG